MYIRFLLLIITAFTFIINANAQKEFIYAREFQLLTQIDKLDTSVLYDHEKTDWMHMKDFLKDPVGYVTNPDNPPFDPLVLMKIQEMSNKASLFLSERNGGEQNKESGIPGELLSTTDLTSKVIYATGQLLLERAEQELYVAHFEQVKKVFEQKRTYKYRLKNGALEEIQYKIKDLMPNSYLIISDFNTLTQPQLGPTLQKAFEQDLQQFYQNMSRHLLPAKIRELWPFLFIDVAYTGIQHLNAGMHPSGVLNELAIEYHEIPGDGSTTYSHKQQLSIGFNMLNAISESLVAQESTSASSFAQPKSYWVTRKSFADLSLNGYKYYLCLLYLNHRELFNALNIDFSKIGERKATQYEEFKLLVNEVLTNLEWIDTKMADFKKKREDKKEIKDFEQVIEYSKAVVSLLDLVKPILCNYAKGRAKTLCDDYDKLRPQLELALTIPADVKSKEYGSAFIKSYNIGKTLLEHYSDSVTLTEDTELIRYLTLANDIVQADSVDQIKKVLDAAILPVGSYALKRNFTKTITINSYVGITGGQETVFIEQASENTRGFHIGPFAPIGIDCSWGSKKGHSNGLFISFIDLGAVVNMYFSDEDKVDVADESGSKTEVEVDVQTLPQLELKHIFAPGIFYVHGFKDSPVSTGFGAQLAPELREVSISNGADISQSALRFSLFIAVDIPLFTISRGKRTELE